MKKRILATVLVLCMSLGGIACAKGESTPAVNGNAAADSVASEEVDYEKAAAENPLIYEFMENITPLYATSKQDVSGSYYLNEKLSLDKGLSELTGVTYEVSSLSEQYDTHNREKYDNWDAASKVYTGIDSYVQLYADDVVVDLEPDYDKTDKFEHDWNVMKGSGYTMTGHYETFEDLANAGAYGYYFEHINSEMHISEVINIEKGKFADELNKLVELWGQPSIAIYNYSTTATLVWCFEKLCVTVHFGDYSQFMAEDAKDLRGSYIGIDYCTYEQMYADLRDSYDSFYKDETPAAEETATDKIGESGRLEEAKSMTSETGNMPESIILTYEGQEIDLLNTGYPDLETMATSVFTRPETMISGGLHEKANEVYISLVPYDEMFNQIHIKGSDGNLTENFDIEFSKARNALDVSIMGIDKNSNVEDVYNIFGYSEIAEDYYGLCAEYSKTIGGQACNINVYFVYDSYKDDLFVEKLRINFDV